MHTTTVTNALLMSLVALAIATVAFATQSTGQTIARAGTKASSAGPEQFFTGRVRIDPLYDATANINASGAYVTFEPGARSAWHTHPKGQHLIVTQGVGRTQEWGKPVQEIKPGDVVWCPPGVKHWHGAAPTTAMTHLTVTGHDEKNQNVSWMEKVTDEQYGAATSAESMQPASRVVNVKAATMNQQNTLSARQQAILPIAAFTATGDMPRLREALNRGLDAGLTVNEVKELLVQLYAYVGFPRSLNALGEFMTVLQQRESKGMKDSVGREPGRLPAPEQMLAAGTANQTKLVGKPVSGPLYDFAPAVDEYLKAHLFGAIFERDNLDWQARELATVGALSALQGVDPQVQSHMNISLNVGLSEAQLRQAIAVLRTHVSAQAAERAHAALKRQLATK